MKVIYDRVLNMLREGSRTSGSPGSEEPAFTSFQLTGVPLVLEVGQALGPGITFTWTTQNSALIAPNTVGITDVTNSVLLADNLANDGTELVTLSAAITKTSPSIHVFSIKAKNINTDVYFSRDTNQIWQQRAYYGESPLTTLDEVGIKALRENALKDSSAGTYAFNAGDYKYLAFAASQGVPQQFIDADTDFAVAMDTPFQVAVTNSYGVVETYNVYRTYNVLNSAINIRVI